MKLIRDERAYRRVLQDVVACRLTGRAFILRFSHLWECDAAPIGCTAHVDPELGAAPDFYALLDAVNALCEEYARSLPDGCGYRVSEEQFRQEVQTLFRAKEYAALCASAHRP